MIEVKLSVNGVVVGFGSMPDHYVKLLDEGTRLTARIDPTDERYKHVPIFVDLRKKQPDVDI